MGDGSIIGGIAEAVKDVGKDIGTEVVKVPLSFAKGAATQISGHELAPEDEEKRQKDLAHVRAQLAQTNMSTTTRSRPGEGPEIITRQTVHNEFSGKKRRSPFKTLAEEQAVRKSETGRGAKG